MLQVPFRQYGQQDTRWWEECSADADGAVEFVRWSDVSAELAMLHDRLEDNRVWQVNPDDPDGPMVVVPVEPGSIPDGIEARDETIKLQDKNIDTLRAKVSTLQEALLRIAFKSYYGVAGNPAEWPSTIAYLALGGRTEDGQQIDTEVDIRRALNLPPP